MTSLLDTVSIIDELFSTYIRGKHVKKCCIKVEKKVNAEKGTGIF